jgi:hypothetical protein
MAKAFRCDKCGTFHDGNSDMQVGLDKQGETILRHTLGIKFSPEMEQEAQIYLKDLCNSCTKSFCEWIKRSVNDGKS